MPNFARWTVLAIVGLVVLGCGSSTGPTPLTAAQIARHIDSLASATTSPARWYVLINLEFGPANGAVPVPIEVTTRMGPERWQAYITKQVTPGGVNADSVYTIVAYSDYALTNVLNATTVFFHNQPGTVATLLFNDTLYVAGGIGSATGTTVSTGTGCALASGLAHYTVAEPSGDCFLATFTGSLSWTFASGDAELRTVSIADQSFSGLFVK